MNKRFLFFDLDHTLWDYDRNADETLAHLFFHFHLQNIAEGSLADFQRIYHEINRRMWSEYDRGIISKERLRHQRFEETLVRMGASREAIPHGMWEMFLEICPQKTHLMDGAVETLEHLKKRYTLAIITNGFERTQNIKLRSSGIAHFFSEVVTSESLGIPKPHPAIYQEMLRRFDAPASQCMMIGDNAVNDVEGAVNAGIESIHYHPHCEEGSPLAKIRIRELTQLKELL